MRPPHTVIVGAGVAGLTAGVRLAAAGRRVLVLEARSRLGGRATAFADRVTGAEVDNGQHVLFGCYRETLDLLRTIGAEGNVRIQPTLTVPFIDLRRRKTWLRCPDLPPPLHLLGGLMEWDALRWRDRRAAARVWRAVNRARASGLTLRQAQGAPSSSKDGLQGRDAFASRHSAFGIGPALSVREWLVSLRQTGRLRDFLWEPLAVAALNEPPEIGSAAAFAEVLALMFGGEARNSAVVMPRVPLDQMYAAPARAFIEARSGQVRLNALAKVIADDASVKAVRVGDETIPCDAVVSTVPWNSFATLFVEMPGALRDTAAAAARVISRPIVTANLWYDRLVMDDEFVGLPNATIQFVFEKGRDASHLSCIVSGAMELVDRSSDEIIAIARADVEDRLPRARRAGFVRGAVVRERHATFSTAQPDVPRPATRTPVPGLFLAGDWIDTGLPGTIEGAARSGALAARAVLAWYERKEETSHMKEET